MKATWDGIEFELSAENPVHAAFAELIDEHAQVSKVRRSLSTVTKTEPVARAVMYTDGKLVALTGAINRLAPPLVGAGS